MKTLHITDDGDCPWRCRVYPSSYLEAVKVQFGAVPGVGWDELDKCYVGPIDAIELIVATLESAGVARRKDKRISRAAHVSPVLALPDTLRQYQVEGITWLVNQLTQHGAALLADEMGLGKTPQALVTADALSVNDLLVICPKIVKKHWENQAKKWQLKANLTVYSYEKFRNLKKKPDCDLLVLDECHYIKTAGAKRSRAVADYVAEYRPKILAMTGTPLDKHPGDLFSTLDLMFPGAFGRNLFAFQKRYCDGKFVEIPHVDHAVWQATGTSHLDELHARLKSIVLRRAKSQVAAELPSRQRIIHEIELDKKIKKSWCKAVELGDRDMGKLLSSVEPLKIDHVVELADQAVRAGSRVLIGCLLKSTVKQISLALTGHSAVAVTGELAADERVATLADATIGVATIDSLTTGVDLVQFDVMIFAGLPYVPSKILQFEGRIHRIGQRNMVTVHYCIAAGTVDEVIRERILERLDTFETVFGAGDGSMLATNLGGGTEEELLDAFFARLT